MALIQSARRVVRPRYRANWIRGRQRTDGILWFVRGTDFQMTHEDWLRNLLHPFGGKVFVDIGAHVGTWAIRATRTFRRVVAFEPTPTTNKILRTTIAMNMLSNISVHSIKISNLENQRKSLAEKERLKPLREESVTVRTLDSFGLKPSLIKIDTEGDEFLVLQGAQETLRDKPKIVIETHSSESLQQVRAHMRQKGYTISEVRKRNRFNQLQSWLICS